MFKKKHKKTENRFTYRSRGYVREVLHIFDIFSLREIFFILLNYIGLVKTFKKRTEENVSISYITSFQDSKLSNKIVHLTISLHPVSYSSPDESSDSIVFSDNSTVSFECGLISFDVFTFIYQKRNKSFILNNKRMHI